MLVALLLVACGGELVVESSQAGCTNVDFDEEAPTEIEVSQNNLAVNVRRTNTYEGCDALFDPVVTSDGNVISIREYWIDDTDDDCDTCWVPTVTIVDAPGGKLEYRWYLGDEDVPLDTVEFKAD